MARLLVSIISKVEQGLNSPLFLKLFCFYPQRFASPSRLGILLFLFHEKWASLTLQHPWQEGVKFMEEDRTITDTGEMKDRQMIELFTKKIQEKKLNPNLLKGSWDEARELLMAHFGQLSSKMEINKYKLLALYQLSIMELQTG
jgi:hypothetical protein